MVFGPWHGLHVSKTIVFLLHTGLVKPKQTIKEHINNILTFIGTKQKYVAQLAHLQQQK